MKMMKKTVDLQKEFSVFGKGLENIANAKTSVVKPYQKFSQQLNIDHF
jgi:hypothetical protein